MEKHGSWLDSESYVAPSTDEVSTGAFETAAQAAQAENPWQSNVDPTSGATYYYNTVTNMTQWTNPFEEEASPGLAAATPEAAVPPAVAAVESEPAPAPAALPAALPAVLPPVPPTAEEELWQAKLASSAASPLSTSSPALERPSAAEAAPGSGLDTHESAIDLPPPAPASTTAGAGLASAVGAMTNAKKMNRVLLAAVKDMPADLLAAQPQQPQPQQPHQPHQPQEPQPLKAPGLLPPPAPSVPVDALVRAGERSDRWLEYVKRHLLLTGHVMDAGIFDLRNCARWAATRDFLPRHYHIMDGEGRHHGVNEAASTVFLLKSGRLPKHGLRFNGVLYELAAEPSELAPTRPNGLARWAVRGRKDLPPHATALGTGAFVVAKGGGGGGGADGHWHWSGGIHLVRTSRALVAATFNEGSGHSGDVCRLAVEGLARFMTDYAC